MRKYRKPYRVKKKKSILRSRFFWLGILISVAAVGIFYLICFSSFFQIKEIKITGNEKVLTEALQNSVQNQIERKILFFASKSIFLVNINRVTGNILNNFPHIAEVKIRRDFPNALNIIISERVGLTVWCQTEKCFLLDGEGVIFEEIFDLNPNTFKIENLVQPNEFKPGEKAIEKEELNKALYLESKLRDNLKIPLKEMGILSEERFNAKTLENWEIYFNPKGDLDWQLTKLNAVLEEEIPPEKRKALEYIELRFGNLASYKYR